MLNMYVFDEWMGGGSYPHGTDRRGRRQPLSGGTKVSHLDNMGALVEEGKSGQDTSMCKRNHDPQEELHGEPGDRQVPKPRAKPERASVVGSHGALKAPSGAWSSSKEQMLAGEVTGD